VFIFDEQIVPGDGMGAHRAVPGTSLCGASWAYGCSASLAMVLGFAFLTLTFLLRFVDELRRRPVRGPGIRLRVRQYARSLVGAMGISAIQPRFKTSASPMSALAERLTTG
jgi:hypothetical protein